MSEQNPAPSWEKFKEKMRPFAGHLCVLYDSEIVRLIGVAQDERDLFYIVAHNQSSMPYRISVTSAVGPILSIEHSLPEERRIRMHEVISMRSGAEQNIPWMEVNTLAGEEYPPVINEVNDGWSEYWA